MDAVRQAFHALYTKEGVQESEVQTFMEQHSELIPTPHLLGHDLHWSGVISKFDLDRDKKPDFAYLTKNTAHWLLVLIELERPSKKLFISTPYVDFHSETRAAIAQVEDWKGFVEQHHNEVRRRLRSFMHAPDMADNPLSVKYVLVIGTNPAAEFSAEQSLKIQRLREENGITLCTYDSILRMGYGFGIGSKKNIFFTS